MRFYIFFIFPLPFRRVPTLPCVPEGVTLSSRPLGTTPFFRISLWFLAGQGPQMMSLRVIFPQKSLCIRPTDFSFLKTSAARGGRDPATSVKHTFGGIWPRHPTPECTSLHRQLGRRRCFVYPDGVVRVWQLCSFPLGVWTQFPSAGRGEGLEDYR